MKKTKGVDRKTHLKGEINERKQNLSERRRALDLQERLRNMKDVEKKKVAEGKKPYVIELWVLFRGLMLYYIVVMFHYYWCIAKP